MVDEDRSAVKDRGGRRSADGTRSHVSQPAQRLYDLALDYAERSLSSQEELVRAFEAEAARWAGTVGEVVIDNDDDEQLRLGTDGRFNGRVFEKDTGAWEVVASPERVAAHYDPVDLFNDLADALEELFPGLDEDADDRSDEAGSPEPIERYAPPERTGPRAAPERMESLAPLEPIRSPAPIPPTAPIAPPTWISDHGANEPSAGDTAEPFREQIRALEDLRNAGVLTPAQFETAKGKLTHR